MLGIRLKWEYFRALLNENYKFWAECSHWSSFVDSENSTDIIVIYQDKRIVTIHLSVKIVIPVINRKILSSLTPSNVPFHHSSGFYRCTTLFTRVPILYNIPVPLKFFKKKFTFGIVSVSLSKTVSPFLVNQYTAHYICSTVLLLDRKVCGVLLTQMRRGCRLKCRRSKPTLGHGALLSRGLINRICWKSYTPTILLLR
jgi:hypothetical protein